jgi:hypothetical protein
MLWSCIIWLMLEGIIWNYSFSKKMFLFLSFMNTVLFMSQNACALCNVHVSKRRGGGGYLKDYLIPLPNAVYHIFL